MSPTLSPTFREDIGGRRLLDRRILAWYAPPALLTSVLTRDPDDLRTVLAWVGVNLASIAITWLWIELLRVTVAARRASRPVPVALVLAIGATVGLAKGVTTSVFAWTAGLLPLLMPLEEWWRAVSTTAQGMFFVPALALVVATLDRYRDEYDRLVGERARAALVRRPARDAPLEAPAGAPGPSGDDERSALVAGFVAEARRRLSTAEDRTVALVLQRLVDDRLRPMTHELWATERIGTDFRVPSLIRSGIRANPFPILPVAGLYALTGFASRAQGTDLATNAVRTAASVAVIAALFTIARRLRPRSPSAGPVHLAAVVSVTAILLTFAAESLGPETLTWRTGTLLATIAVWIAVLTVVSGASVVAVRGGDAMRDELRRAIEEDRSVERAAQRLRDREFADLLHSTLQNRLISAAHRIAASSEHESVVREELDAIELLLADLAAGVSGGDTAKVGTRAQLADVVARWDGFVTITSQLDPPMDQAEQAVQDRLAQVLVEAINNAVRHGRAARVDVRVIRTADPSLLQVTVDDDGVGPILREAGLGSRLFDAVSADGWSLAARPEGGSRLRMTVRIQPAVH